MLQPRHGFHFFKEIILNVLINVQLESFNSHCCTRTLFELPAQNVSQSLNLSNMHLTELSITDLFFEVKLVTRQFLECVQSGSKV